VGRGRGDGRPRAVGAGGVAAAGRGGDPGGRLPATLAALEDGAIGPGHARLLAELLGPLPDDAPAAPLRAFVRARDRRCRFPGCRAAAIRCDLDHTMPWPAGPTSADNLCCLCRHHHRLSHQAPGWRLRHRADGGLEWTTPGGDRITTQPPAYGTDDHPPREPEPPPAIRELVLGRPHPPGTTDPDPAPF